MSKENEFNKQGVNAVSNALGKALDAVGSTGSLVTQVCNAAGKHYGDDPVPSTDVKAIADKVAESRGWVGTPAEQVRRSEVTVLLSQHMNVPKAIELYRSKNNDRATWHDGIGLARKLKASKGNVKEAVAAYIERRGSNDAKPKDVPRKDAKRKASMAIKNILKHTKLEKPFRDALRELAEEYGLNLGNAGK